MEMDWRRLRRSSFALLAGLLLISLGACGGTDEDRPDLDSLGNGKGDIPNYFKYVKSDWGCGEVAEGTFAGMDSAHAYTLQLKQGMRYTFAFSAKYAISIAVKALSATPGCSRRSARSMSV